MNEDFERRLHAQFAASGDLPPSEQFGRAVHERIARLRLAWRVASAAAIVVGVAAGVAVAVVGAPMLTSGSTLIAEAPDALNGLLSGLLVSPAGIVLGAMTAAATLAAAFAD